MLGIHFQKISFLLWFLVTISTNDWLKKITLYFFSSRKNKGDIPFVADRWGLQNVYCPNIIRKIQKTKDKQRCIKMRRKKTSVNLCTSKEKKLWKQYNQKWPWNTRNCSSLKPRKKEKQCKKEKRLRGCVEKHLKKKKGYGKKKAWLICIQKLKFVRYKFWRNFFSLFNDNSQTEIALNYDMNSVLRV